MSTHMHKLEVGRRNERPTWAINEKQLARVLATYMEARASLGKRNHEGTPAERIKRAQVRIKSQLPNRIETIQRLCKEYVELKRSPAATHKRLRELEGQIESLDTYICASQKDGGLLSAVGCVQGYFREGLTSVECAERLHIKPPHVRAIIWRLNKSAEKVKNEVHVTMRINLLRGLRINPVAVPGSGQKQCWVCGCMFTPEHKQRNVCSRRCRHKRINQVEQAKKKGLPAPPKYYCGPLCKDTARFAVKALPVPAKPGVGAFVPVPNGDRYQNYIKFCMVVGTIPQPEEQWRLMQP